MTRPRVVITQRVFPETIELLSPHAEVIANDAVEPWSPWELLRQARDAQALMVFMPDALDADFIRQCPNLRIVAAALKGYDNFDVRACAERGIWFTTAPDLLSEPTAELALALLLGLVRHVRAGDELVRSGEFQGWRPQLYGKGLVAGTLGLLGYGAVGRTFERLVAGFRCRVICHDTSFVGVSLDEVLAQSDFLLPLLPLTTQTFHLINEAAIRRMMPSAYLINVGRGSVVDEEAVADALESGRLAGYAADVFEMEDWARTNRPLAISARLLNCKERTLFTPHLGSATATARLEIERAAATNILDVLKGERPRDALVLEPLV